MDKDTINTLAEFKAMLSKLIADVSSMKVENAENRVLIKGMLGSIQSTSDAVQSLDKQIEASLKQAVTQAKEQKATEEAKKMTLSEIGALYKKDPVAARKAMEAQGMKIGTEEASNPWLYRDETEKKRIRSIDPELADRLRSQAVAHNIAMNR